MLLRSGLAYRHLEQVSCGDLEVIWITVQLQSGDNVVVRVAYRPGSCSDSDISMIEHNDSTIDKVRQKGSNIIIAGDFNVHNRAWLHSTRTSVAGEAAEDMGALHGLTQHVLEPDRDANTLDLVMTDFQDPVHIQEKKETIVSVPEGNSRRPLTPDKPYRQTWTTFRYCPQLASPTMLSS